MRIVYWYLKQEPDLNARLAVLQQAMYDTYGISIPLKLVSTEQQRAEKQGANHERLISDYGLTELKAACVLRIATAAESGALANVPDLVMVLYRWREWDHEDAPRQFCERLIQTPEGALQLTKAFLQRSTSVALGDHVGRDRWYIKLGAVEDFVPWEALEKAIEPVNADSLGDEERRALTAFREAVARRQQGKPDVGGPHDEFE